MHCAHCTWTIMFIHVTSCRSMANVLALNHRIVCSAVSRVMRTDVRRTATETVYVHISVLPRTCHFPERFRSETHTAIAARTYSVASNALDETAARGAQKTTYVPQFSLIDHACKATLNTSTKHMLAQCGAACRGDNCAQNCRGDGVCASLVSNRSRDF